MAAPLGNKNGRGMKGRSGRKSKFQEIAEARDVEAIFFNEHDQEALENKVRSGKFSIKDRFILTAMEGDTQVLITSAKKVFPDKTKLSGDPNAPVIIHVSSAGEKKYGTDSSTGKDTA